MCLDGGLPQNLFQWEEAKWIGGTLAFMNWTKQQPVAANTIQMTTNFTYLQQFASSPATVSLKTFLQNKVRLIIFLGKR
jgi:hypothetical protein